MLFLPACLVCRVPRVACHVQVRSARRAAAALTIALQQEADNLHQHQQQHQQQQQVLPLPEHSAKVPQAVALVPANATTPTQAPSPETSLAADPHEIASAPRGGAAVTAVGTAGVDITVTTDPGVAAEAALLKRTCVAYVLASGVQLPNAAVLASAGSKLPPTCIAHKRSNHYGILDSMSRCFRPNRAAAFTFEAGPSTPSATARGAATANGYPVRSGAVGASGDGGEGGDQGGMNPFGATRALPLPHTSPQHGSVSACSMEINSNGSGSGSGSSGIEHSGGSSGSGGGCGSSNGGNSSRGCGSSHTDAAQLPLPDWNDGIVIFGLRKVYGGHGVVRSAFAAAGTWSRTMVQGAWRRLRCGVGSAWGRCRRGGANTQAQGRGQQQGADGSGSGGTSPVHDSLFLSGTPELAAASTTAGLAGSLGTASAPAAATATASVQVTPGGSSSSSTNSSGAAGPASGGGGDGSGGEDGGTAPPSRTPPRTARGAPHVAVHGTWLRIGTGECFCLLGE